MGPTVAIMQPYFLPYAGYFRLIAGSDTFVIYDCVQFPRRGWVHRNKLRDLNGVERWLTLPLRAAPQDALITELEFAEDAPAELGRRLRPFGLTRGAASDILKRVTDLRGRPVDYIADLLKAVCETLEVPWNVVRSSSLGIPQTLRGQDRILEIARRLGAGRYINAPGGRELYDPAVFGDAGIGLQFLPRFTGPTASILQRLLDDRPEDLRRELYDWQAED